jgi:uncharacterized protein (DUF608 family)
MKDVEFEKKCTSLFTNGSKWIDANIFNGEFYYQKIWPVKSKDDVANGLRVGMGATDLSKPDFQVGEGCMIDQLVGQNMAFICGLGYLADSTHIKKAMASIWKYNHRSSFDNYFNNMRSYVLGDESGVVVTSYPDPSKRPAIPLSYGLEVWTGVEYTAAAGMFFAGMDKEANQVIRDVRNRYDGYKRNPFNEEECGNHYVRAMASWSEILAVSKFHYSGVTGTFSITSRPGNYFWSNGYSWGNAKISENEIVIAVHYGELNLKAVRLSNGKAAALKLPVTIGEGRSVGFALK